MYRASLRWMYYRYKTVITPLKTRFSSVHVVHTCGLLALFLIAVWEILMKNKDGWQEEAPQYTWVIPHIIRKLNSRCAVCERQHYDEVCAYIWKIRVLLMTHSRLPKNAFFPIGQLDLEQLWVVGDHSFQPTFWANEKILGRNPAFEVQRK